MPALTRPPLLDATLAAACFGGGIGPTDGGFAEGTRIATPAGPRAVETLRAGDMVCTASGGVTRLRAVVVREAPCVMQAVSAGDPEGDGEAGPEGAVAPGEAVRIPAGSLGAGVPGGALVVGAGQPLLLDGFALAAAALVCGGTIAWAPAPRRLYRLATTAAGTVLAEGLGAALHPPVRPERDVRAGAALARLRLGQRPVGRAGGGLLGAVSLDGAGTLRGWAFDPALPAVRVLLELLRDDRTIGFALADESRPDLAMQGLADGACGFALPVPPEAFAACAYGEPASAGVLLRLHAVGTGATLPGMPLLFDPGVPVVQADLTRSPAEALARLLGGTGAGA